MIRGSRAGMILGLLIVVAVVYGRRIGGEVGRRILLLVLVSGDYVLEVIKERKDKATTTTCSITF